MRAMGDRYQWWRKSELKIKVTVLGSVTGINSVTLRESSGFS